MNEYQIFLSAGRSGGLLPIVYNSVAWTTYLQSMRYRLELANIRPVGLRIALVGTSDPRHTLVRCAAAFPDARLEVIGVQEGFQSVYERLETFQPQIVIGVSSILDILLKDFSLKCRATAVFTGTDTLTNTARRRIVETWGAEVYDAYGATEIGLLAAECSEHNGLHLIPSQNLVEICGETPVVTNLVNSVQPIIRYRLLDTITVMRDQCPCGNSMPRLLLTSGRIQQFAIIDGNPELVVHPLVIRSAVDSLDGVNGCDVVPTSGNRLNIIIYGTPDYSQASAALWQAFRRAQLPFYEDMVHIEIVSPNPQT